MWINTKTFLPAPDRPVLVRHRGHIIPHVAYLDSLTVNKPTFQFDNGVRQDFEDTLCWLYLDSLNTLKETMI
jgi:hypothetical protein